MSLEYLRRYLADPEIVDEYNPKEINEEEVVPTVLVEYLRRYLAD